MAEKMTLEQQWDDIDLLATGLWRHLLRYDYRKAAVGLLQDLLKELHDREEIQREDLAAGKSEKLPDGTEINAALVAEYRERLMKVLDDQDGTQLSKWQGLYHQYRYDGIDHEQEAFFAHPFFRQAVKLVVESGNRLKAAESDD
jgi:hypothetical protein